MDNKHRKLVANKQSNGANLRLKCTKIRPNLHMRSPDLLAAMEAPTSKGRKGRGSLGLSYRGKYPYFWSYPNSILTQCRMGEKKLPCQNPPRFVQPFR